jgi:hypothetical protein
MPDQRQPVFAQQLEPGGIPRLCDGTLEKRGLFGEEASHERPVRIIRDRFGQRLGNQPLEVIRNIGMGEHLPDLSAERLSVLTPEMEEKRAHGRANKGQRWLVQDEACKRLVFSQRLSDSERFRDGLMCEGEVSGFIFDEYLAADQLLQSVTTDVQACMRERLAPLVNAARGKVFQSSQGRITHFRMANHRLKRS